VTKLIFLNRLSFTEKVLSIAKAFRKMSAYTYIYELIQKVRDCLAVTFSSKILSCLSKNLAILIEKRRAYVSSSKKIF